MSSNVLVIVLFKVSKMCFPKIEYVKADYKGGYYEGFNIIQLSTEYSPISRFITLIHEMGHWLIFRLGRTDFVYTLNCIWDFVWGMTIDHKSYLC